ncbi:MAG: hypothetical protein M1837_005748 [Sclerophora amabilis]|nr:MAG: hypothetical protein M1837_005748 [Sclerophora amabilis]
MQREPDGHDGQPTFSLSPSQHDPWLNELIERVPHAHEEQPPRIDDEVNPEDCFTLKLTREDVGLFEKVLRGRRRKRRLKKKLHDCEESTGYYRKRMRDSTDKMQDLVACRARLPKSERLAHLRLQMRIKELDLDVKGSKELYAFKEHKRRKLTAVIQQDRRVRIAEKNRFFDSYDNVFLGENTTEEDIGRELDGAAAEAADRPGNRRVNIKPFNPDLRAQEEKHEVAGGARDRPATLSELRAMEHQIDAQENELHNRAAIHEEEDRFRRQEIAQGRALSFTTTQYDLEALKEDMDKTGALIQVEAKYRDAKARRRELFGSNDFIQQSDFADHPDDGYRDSLDVEKTTRVNHRVLYRWLEGVSGGFEDLPPKLHDDSKIGTPGLVGVGESLSVTEPDAKHRKKIMSWNENVEEQHQESARVKRRRESREENESLISQHQEATSAQQKSVQTDS